MDRTRKLVVLATSAIALLVFTPAANAAPGDLDTSFGGGDGFNLNRPINTSTPDSTRGYRSKLLSDGSVIVAAVARENILITKFASSGQIDSSFATNGTHEVDVTGNSYDEPHALEVQSDGKIVVAGRGGGDAFILRLLANGQPDTTFGGDGLVTHHETSSSVEFNTLGIQASGNYVVATSSLGDLTLMRYLPTGAIDASFGSSGKQTFTGENFGTPLNLDIDSSDHIVVAGTGGGGSFKAARFTTGGSPDPLYGTGGIANLTGLSGAFSDMSVDASERAVLVGSDSGVTVVARVDLNGGLDTNFDTDGIAVFDPSGNDEDAGAVETVGSLVYVAGRQGNFGGYVAKFGSTGVLDTSFPSGPADYVQTTCTAGGALPVCGIQDLDATVFNDLSWIAENSSIDSDTTADIGRLDSAGAPVTAFDTDGKRNYQIDTPDNVSVYDSSRAPDGRVLVSGIAGPYNLESSYFSMYTAQGVLDPTFGSGGSVVHDFFPAANDYLSGATVDSLGRVYAFGYVSGGPDTELFVARFTASGVLDATFDGDGYLQVNIDSDDEYPSGMTILPSGNMLVTGSIYNGPSDQSVFAVELNTSGAIPSSFNGGVARTVHFSTTENLQVGKAVRSASGRTVIAFILDKQLRMLWLGGDGSLDTGPDASGVTAYPFIGTVEDSSGAPRITPVDDDYVIAVSKIGGGTGVDAVVTKVDQSGATVGSFGAAGKTEVTFPTLSNENQPELAMDSAGRFTISTATDSGGANRKLLVARLLANGTLDPAYGGLHALGLPLTRGYSRPVGLFQDGNRMLAFAGEYEPSTALSSVMTAAIVNDLPSTPPATPAPPSGPSAACIAAKKKLASLQKKLKKQKKALKKAKARSRKAKFRKQIKKINKQIRAQKRTVKRLCG